MRLGIGALCAGMVMAVSVASAQQNDVCQPQVESRLKEAGIEWSKLQNVQWDVDTWNEGPREPPDISGYQFYARPASCKQGSIVVEMDQDCRISDVFARRGCEVPGLK